MTIPDWIFIDGKTSEMFCERCGEREKPKLPMPITVFIKWSEYFNSKHEYCQKKDAGERVEGKENAPIPPIPLDDK